MYKLLLSWRYLRTRYIALASIISVTLGVATLIVVNSVMSGFSAEMHKRLHGILSDVVVESPGLDGIADPEQTMEEIRKVVGDQLAGMSAVVRVPAMLHFQYRGKSVIQQIMLIGVDEKTYAEVSDFRPYLLHPSNQQRLSFDLHESGYSSRIPEDAGWSYRRRRISYQRAYQEQLQQLEASQLKIPDSQSPPTTDSGPEAQQTSRDNPYVVAFPPIPDIRPPIEQDDQHQTQTDAVENYENVDQADPASDPFLAGDPARAILLADSFDEMNEQYTGIILGISLVSTKYHSPETQQVEDLFLALPGDDVQITLPSTGMPPKPISATMTVVDFYESKMSEYDSSFAFMPLIKLQRLRGMVDVQSGAASVTSIQLKLASQANLNTVRDQLRMRFPPHEFPYRIQTWRDMQGPLLAAVRLETTILNILLFLIIAVAGFGILATFFMIVVEKTRDIGVLKALGAPSGGIMSIFLTYGLSLGAVGSGVGIVLGLLFVVYINDVASVIERITGQKVFDETIYYFQEIPTIIDPFTVAWVAAGAVMIAVLASVLPAMRAARLHPVEALRYE